MVLNLGIRGLELGGLGVGIWDIKVFMPTKWHELEI